MAINYAEKYSPQVDERFNLGSLTTALVNNAYDWLGVATVKVYSVPTAEMNDYTLTGSNRYGTPAELNNEVQEMTLAKDRSFTFTIDKKSEAKDYKNSNAMINLLYQTYLIVLPIILGYIIWLLKEQKKKQINDAKARDERIQEEYKKRNANCDGTKALLKIGLYEYHDKYVELGYIPSYAYENFCDMYEAYHALGGNGTGTILYEEIKALHLKNKGDKD